MADKDDKDTSFGGSQGGYGKSPGGGGAVPGNSWANDKGNTSTPSTNTGGGGNNAPGNSWANDKGNNYNAPTTNNNSPPGNSWANDAGNGGGNTPSPGYGWANDKGNNTPTGTSPGGNTNPGGNVPGNSYANDAGNRTPTGMTPGTRGLGSVFGGDSLVSRVTNIPAPTGLPTTIGRVPTGYEGTYWAGGRFGPSVPTPTGMTPYDKLKNAEDAMEPDLNPKNPRNRMTDREVLEMEQQRNNYYDPKYGAAPAAMTERAALGTTNPATGLPSRVNAPGMSYAGTERAPAAPTPTGYNPSTGMVGATIDPNQFSNPSMYGSAARVAENQSMRDLANMSVPGNTMAGTEGTPRGLGMSMAGTETAPAHAGVGPTGFSLDNRNRMTPAMGGVHSAVYGPTEEQMASSSAARATENLSMNDLGALKESYRQAIAQQETGGIADPYSKVHPGVPQKNGTTAHALGKYGIMDFNVGPWSKEVLGTAISTEDFLANPAVQDKIFDAKIGGYVSKYGTFEKAAQAWYGGPGSVGKRGASPPPGVAGPNVGTYGDTVSARQDRIYNDLVAKNRDGTSIPTAPPSSTNPPANVPTSSDAPAPTPTPAPAPTPTPAPRGTPAAAGGTVTTTAAPPGTAGFPATPPSQAQAPGFPSRKTPATGYTRSGLGTVLGLGVDAGLTVAGGPVSLGINLLSGLAFGDSVGGVVADAVGGKYGPNQYAPGRDDRYSGDRGTVGSGNRGVNNPQTIGTGKATTPTTTTAPVIPTADEFIDKYIDPPYPTPFESWGKDFGWSKPI